MKFNYLISLSESVSRGVKSSAVRLINEITLNTTFEEMKGILDKIGIQYTRDFSGCFDLSGLPRWTVGGYKGMVLRLNLGTLKTMYDFSFTVKNDYDEREMFVITLRQDGKKDEYLFLDSTKGMKRAEEVLEILRNQLETIVSIDN